MREVAAYLLDRGFAGVPASVLVKARHPALCYNLDSSSSSSAASPYAPAPSLPMKLSSLQAFIPHDCDSSEMGPSRFSVRDVHRIGILDIRLFNTDRHAGNMLVRKGCDGQHQLVPIDHGFCLPEALDAPYFEWLHWPQAMLPFSEEELAYIRALDIEVRRPSPPSCCVSSRASPPARPCFPLSTPTP